MDSGELSAAEVLLQGFYGQVPVLVRILGFGSGCLACDGQLPTLVAHRKSGRDANLLSRGSAMKYCLVFGRARRSISLEIKVAPGPPRARALG